MTIDITNITGCTGTNCQASDANGWKHSSECKFEHRRAVASGIQAIEIEAEAPDDTTHLRWRGKRVDLQAAAAPSAPQGGGVEALRALLRGYEKDAVSPERIAIRDALRIAIPLLTAQPRTDASTQVAVKDDAGFTATDAAQPPAEAQLVAAQAEQSDRRTFPMGYDSHLHGLVTDNVASALLCCGIEHLPAGVLDTIASEIVRGYHASAPQPRTDAAQHGEVVESVAIALHRAYNTMLDSADFPEGWPGWQGATPEEREFFMRHAREAVATPPSAPECGACNDGCKDRGSCRVRDESPPSAPVGGMADDARVPDDYRNQASGYRAGWNDALACRPSAPAPVAGDAVGFDAWWMRTNGTPVTGSVAENAARAAWQAALAQDRSSQAAAPSAPVGVAIASDEDMHTLFRLRENLEDLKRRRWKGKNWDVDDGYVNANIGHAEKAAEWALPALNRVLGVLIDNANHRATLAQQPAAAAHPDDAAVDAFAAAMKEKLAAARAKGRGGWNGDEPGMRQRLSDMLRAHVEKGDPRDVANFAMFLHQRGESILPSQQPAAVDEVRPLSEWHEDDGPVTWWNLPVDEPAWIGTPLDSDWPGYHSHWTPHPVLPSNAGQQQGDRTDG
mgnify:CR=1 FL=1